MKNNFALAAKAIIMRDDKFLVLHRSKAEMEKSKLNKNEFWDLPGGSIRFFETVENGLLREIDEETQLVTKIDYLFSCYDVIKRGIHMALLTYVCTYKDGEVILSEEHDAFYWLKIDEMESMKLPHWMIRDFKKAGKVYTEQ